MNKIWQREGVIQEIMQAYASGKTIKEVADEFKISTGKVFMNRKEHMSMHMKQRMAEKKGMMTYQ